VDSICSKLTVRERQLIELLAQGKTSKEIAAVLEVAVSTISSHRKSICRKLNVHSSAELIHYSMSIGWMNHRIYGTVLPIKGDCGE
jgi:DNA-binding NarL/FixJ family response regulator